MNYLLYGENIHEKEKYINNLLKHNNIIEKITYDYNETDINTVLEDASYNDLFSNKKLIILNNSTFLTSLSTLDNNNLINYIKNPNPNTYLILNVNNDKLDERKKLVKEIKSLTKVEYFEKIDSKNISNHITKYIKESNYNIDYKSINEISTRLSTYPNTLYSELDKLLLYKSTNKTITLNDVKEVITNYHTNIAFKLTDAITKKDKKEIFTLYKTLINEKTEPISLIALISNNIRLLLNVKILTTKGYNQAQITTLLKEHPYRITLAIESVLNTPKKNLINNLKQLSIIDYQIKTGELDKYKALEVFFISL